MKLYFYIILSLLLSAGCAQTMIPADNQGNAIVPPVPSGIQSNPALSAPETMEEEPRTTAITVTAGGQSFSATLEDSETAHALVQLLPLTLDMIELNGSEKYFYLDQSLPTDAKNPGQIHAGDLMLYGDSCLVVFYESFSTSYSYTRLGAIDDPAGLAQALGRESATVAFAVQD